MTDRPAEQQGDPGPEQDRGGCVEDQGAPGRPDQRPSGAGALPPGLADDPGGVQAPQGKDRRELQAERQPGVVVGGDPAEVVQQVQRRWRGDLRAKGRRTAGPTASSRAVSATGRSTAGTQRRRRRSAPPPGAPPTLGAPSRALRRSWRISRHPPTQRLGPDDIRVSRVQRKDLTPGALAPGLRSFDADALHLSSQSAGQWSPRPRRASGCGRTGSPPRCRTPRECPRTRQG